MLNLLAWAIAGLFIGAIARLLMPGRQSMGIFRTMLLGVVGALVGGGISWAMFGEPGDPFSAHAWPGYLMSIFGAFLVLLLGASASRPAAE